MKIVGIGLNKTGTTTLGIALETLGYDVIGCKRKNFQLWRAGHFDSLLNGVMEDYDAFEDWPWPLMFRRIDQHFEDHVRFILTRRKSAEAWYQSLVKHARSTGPTEYRRVVYGFPLPETNPQAHKQFYEEHLHSVRSYFKEKPHKLLEVAWDEGHGWEELCTFLNRAVPNKPFPHARRS
jgi:hypothetical protein